MATSTVCLTAACTSSSAAGCFELCIELMCNESVQVSANHSDLERCDYTPVFSSLVYPMLLLIHNTRIVFQPTKHPFGLRSSFGADFPFTNFTYKFKCTIDYIWYIKDSLVCESVLGGIEEVRKAERPSCVADVSPASMAYQGCPKPQVDLTILPLLPPSPCCCMSRL